MIEEIQKSIKLINFNDPIFDQTKTGNLNKTNEEQITSTDLQKMLRTERKEGEKSFVSAVLHTLFFKWKSTCEESILTEVNEEKEPFLLQKNVSLEDLLRRYFSSEVDNSSSSLLKEIIVTYGPLLSKNISKTDLVKMVKRERKWTELIEEKCYGSLMVEISGPKEEELFSYWTETFPNDFQTFLKRNYFTVLCKRIPCQLQLSFSSGFEGKKMAKQLSLIEALEYVRMDPREFYYGKERNSSVCEFISIYNKLTNYLISEILKNETREERKLVAKRILKLAKQFAIAGSMNSLKSCMAALQCNSVHRLHVINDQGTKYRNRFEELSILTSPENNFIGMRERACIVPWLGIILRDFTFIRDMSKSISKDKETLVNFPLAMCLRKLMNSMTAALQTCHQIITENEGEMRKIAVMRHWLVNCEILYESEEAQYKRSEELMK